MEMLPGQTLQDLEFLGHGERCFQIRILNLICMHWQHEIDMLLSTISTSFPCSSGGLHEQETGYTYSTRSNVAFGAAAVTTITDVAKGSKHHTSLR